MTFLKVMHDTKNQIINLCATLPLNLGLVPGLYYAITSIIYVSNNQQGILKVMHYTKDQLIDRCTRPPLIKWYLFPGNTFDIFDHVQKLPGPVTLQLLWPLATMNYDELWPWIVSLWSLKCCGLWPQWTLVFSGRK